MNVEQELTPIRFGTDGWRAVIAQEFTFANLERVAQAYADFLHRQEKSENQAGSTAISTTPLVIVGCDRRFLSEQFSRRVAEILNGNGIRAALFEKDVPTPLVSWAVRATGAAGGVVITASHNPPDFNGFKIKAPWGGSALPETTSIVESLIDTQAPRRSRFTSGDELQILQPAVESYRAQIASYIDLERVRSARLQTVVDSMHGSGGRWVESFLREGDLQVETIRAERDPLFGGVSPEPIDRNLGPLKERVKASGATLGLATDGDADRVGAVNDRGETMTMHEVVPLILLHLARERKMKGGVVCTFSQSVLTKRIAAAHNLKVYDTPIGFKYIAELMLREDILLGAEESGGIGVKGHLPERDGILNSLLLVEAIVTAGKTPSELVTKMHQEFGEFYFGRRDLHCEVRRGQDLVMALATAPPIEVADYEVRGVETLDGTKLLFEDESWLLFRQSGTEPMLRIYSEATSQAKVQDLLNAGEKVARK